MQANKLKFRKVETHRTAKWYRFTVYTWEDKYARIEGEKIEETHLDLWQEKRGYEWEIFMNDGFEMKRTKRIAGFIDLACAKRYAQDYAAWLMGKGGYPDRFSGRYSPSYAEQVGA